MLNDQDLRDLPETDLASLFGGVPEPEPEATPMKENHASSPDHAGDRAVGGDHREDPELPAAAPVVPDPAPAEAPVAAAAPPANEPEPAVPATAPEPEPEPPKLTELITRLQALTPEQLANLSELERIGDSEHPYTPQAFSERFKVVGAEDELGLPTRLAVNDREIVLTSSMHEERVDAELLRVPIRRLRSARKRMDSVLNALERSESDMRKRVEKRALKLAREVKGMGRKQKEIELTQLARDLKVFDEGAQKNRVVFGGTPAIQVACEPSLLRDTFVRSPKVAEKITSDKIKLDPNLFAPEARVILLDLAGTFADHKSPLQVATYASRIERTLHLDMHINVDGTSLHFTGYVNKDGKLVLDAPSRSSSSGPSLAPGELLLGSKLEYRIRCKQAEIHEIIELLGQIEPMPVYRDDAVSSLLEENLSL